MWTFIARRLLQRVIVIFGVTLISFVALQIGGDPTYLFVSERATEEEIAMVREALGFDKPLHIQYLTYVANVAQGEFGNSLSYRQPAMEIVLGALPATIELTIFALTFAIGMAIPFGVFAALYRGTPVDGGIMTMAMFGQSVPNFWLGIMMILFFGLYLRWFPISGHVPFLMPLLQGEVALAFSNLPQTLYYLIMPGIDGLEATRQIRKSASEQVRRIPILALTASVIKSEINRALDAGMDGFIPKPFKSFELLNAIHHCLKDIKMDYTEVLDMIHGTVSVKNETVDLNHLREFTEGDEDRMNRFIE